MFGVESAAPEVRNLTESELEISWRTWARREEMNRSVLPQCLRLQLLTSRRVCAALRIHDAEICALSHVEPLLGKNASETLQIASSRAFSAPTVEEWAAVVQNETLAIQPIMGVVQPEIEPSLAAYVVLEGIATTISQDRRHGRLTDEVSKVYHDSLMNWYNSYGRTTAQKRPDTLSLMVLWHWVYMSLLVDFDQIERAIGRDGAEGATSATAYVSQWISTPNSTRCVLHAFLSLRQLRSLPYDHVAAIHVPRVLFSAAIAWYCYLRNNPAGNVARELFQELNTHFPEFGILGPTAGKQLSEIANMNWNRGSLLNLKVVTLCELGEALKRMKHWGIAGACSKIVACLIYHD